MSLASRAPCDREDAGTARGRDQRAAADRRRRAFGRLPVALAGLAMAALPCRAASGAEAGDFGCGAAVLRAVQERYGSPVDVLSLLVYPASAELEARDPGHPSHVDRFSCEEGQVGEPEPVQAGRNQRQLEARLFSLDEEQLAILPGLLPVALESVEAEAGVVSHVSLERSETTTDHGTSWTGPVFRVYVEGPRAGGYVEFRLDGKRGRVVRW